jgi:hypothetical protein
MLSLINFSEAYTSTWLTDSGFTGIQNDYYWTSNVDPDNPTSDAWYIDMSNNDFIYYQSSSSSSYVLAVRGEAKGRIHLPKTGQTTSYVSGDDGDIQAGVDWPDPRFTDNGDGTVTDHLTNLMWQQDADAIGQQTWVNAVSACNSLTLADYDDWRLPNAFELESLVHPGKDDLAGWLNTQGFINFSNTYNYWTSNSWAYTTSRQWFLDLHSAIYSTGTLSYRLIAVRSVE